MNKVFIAGLTLLLALPHVWGQQLAFPTAEGYGKFTKGGRGGAVYEVTTLNATGPGSLGEAINASGLRTIVFRVGGTIEGDFRINNDYITIAGQTAPGDGICIKGSITVDASHVIIRYIRIRANPIVETDAIWGRYNKNIIIDHISASWSSDEVMSLYHNENVTIQWCMITEPCAKGGDGHRFGGIWGGPYGSHHHNLIAHSDSRNPRWASGCGYNDYRNNVLYNWGYNSCYGAEKEQSGKPQFNFSTINMIANYYKPGPGTDAGVRGRIAEPSTRNGEADAGKWWLSGNVVVGNPTVTEDNWRGFARQESYFRLSGPWNAMPINQHSPEEAYTMVLDHAGCSLPLRDTIDKRIIEEVRTGTATYGDNGIITYPSDVGGWPLLADGTPPVDSDHDGMPDDWETNNGLDPDNPDDRNNVGPHGYTMLENYLNSLTGYTPLAVTGVSFQSARDTVETNGKIRLYPIFTPAYAANQTVSWNSSDPTIATVDDKGIVSGVADGTAKITATTNDGGYLAECTVEVITRISVTGVSIDPAEITLEMDSLKQLVAIIEPSDAEDKRVSWASSFPFVASVSSEGIVDANNIGTAIITVTTQDGKYTGTCQVNVVDASTIAQHSSDDDIRIYPNPFSETIIVDFEGLKNVQRLEVLTMNGKLIRQLAENDLSAPYVELSLDLSFDVFLVRIFTTENVYSKKIIRK
jgi:pectate lyase